MRLLSRIGARRGLSALGALLTFLVGSGLFGSLVFVNAAPASAANASFQLMPGFDPTSYYAGYHAPLELGTRISTSSDGFVTEAHFYKMSDDTGTHTAHVWDQQGNLLATKDFTNETASGWQTVTFDTPVFIASGSQFTVSVLGSDYAYFGAAFPNSTAGPLTVINGYYNYTSTTAFPNQSVGTNYGVDLTFEQRRYLPAAAPSQQGPMTLTMSTSADNQSVGLPIGGTVTNVVVDWGDGITSPAYNNVQGVYHSYATAGTYHVSITGDALTHWGMQGFDNSHLVSIESFGTMGLTSLAFAFDGASQLVSLPSTLPAGVTNLDSMLGAWSSFNQDISGWDVSQVTSMRYTFALDSNFDAPLDAWDVSAVTDMEGLFWGDQSFNEPLNSWNTVSVQNFQQTFSWESKFNQPLSNWDTSSATNMNSMFESNYAFNQDISNWDTHNVTNMNNMMSHVFNNGSLSNDQAHPLLTNGNKWNVSKVQSFATMFNGRPFNQDISNWDVSGAADFNWMFGDNHVFDQDLSNWNPSNGVNFNNMFTSSAWTDKGVPLVSDATHWNTSKGQYFAGMFTNTPGNLNFNGLDLTHATNLDCTFCYMPNWNNGGQPVVLQTSSLLTNTSRLFGWDAVFNQPVTLDFSHVTYAYRMFAGSPVFDQDLSGWDTSSLQNASNMFEAATSFNNGGQKLTWDMSQVTTVGNMFRADPNFNADITSWNLSNCQEFGHLFEGDSKFNQPIGNWNVQNVTNTEFTFWGTSSFNQPLANWNVSHLTGAYGMFGQSAFNQDISGWNTSRLVDSRYMFQGDTAFNQPIGAWDVSNVQYMERMFENTTSFNQDLSNWNVAKVGSMYGLFAGSGFNGSVSGWNLNSTYNTIYMFSGDSAFNQPLTGWKTPVLTDTRGMFNWSTAFNQSLANLDISHVTQMWGMLDNSGISAKNYGATLDAWAAGLHQNGVSFSASGRQYSSTAQASRDSLTASMNTGGSGWYINDAGPIELPVDATITTWPTATGITVGQTLALSSLSGGVANVAGTFTFDSPNTIPALGSYTADVTFTPDNLAAYNVVKGTVTVNVGLHNRTLISSNASNYWNYGSTFDTMVSATGGTGSLSYSIDSDSTAVCRFSSTAGVLETLSPGTCNYTVSVDSDGTYAAASYHGSLTVNATNPDAPTVTGFTAGASDTATVTWTAPTFDGGHTIDGYHVTVIGGGQTYTCDVNGTTLTCDITGLSELTEYSVTVTAKTTSGTFESIASNSMSATTPAAPLPTPTPTPTETPSPTVTPTPTDSPTPSVSPTPTDSPTPTVSPSPTVSPTPTPTVTPSPTPAPTVSPTPTPTPSPTVTPSPTPSPTVTPTPTPSPSDTPTPTPSPSLTPSSVDPGTPTPTPTPASSDSANPTPSPTDTPVAVTGSGNPPSDPRDLPPVNPVQDNPVQVAQTTATAVTVVVAVGAAAASVAAVGGVPISGTPMSGPTGGAAGGAGGTGSGGSGGSGSSGSGQGKGASRREDSDKMEESSNLRHMAKGKMSDGLGSQGGLRWGDQLPLWGSAAVLAMDVPPRHLAKRVAPVLPLASKVMADATYLRAMVGTFWLLLSGAAITLGVLGTQQTHGLLLLPSAWLLAAIAGIGAMDILAGFLGGLTLAMGLAITAGVHNDFDLRFLIALVALPIAPRLISGAFRNLHRTGSANVTYVWERAIDVIAAPLLAAWAAKELISLLPVFAGVELPIQGADNLVATVVASTMILRVLLEEASGRYFPNRVSQTQVTGLSAPSVGQQVFSLAARTLIFGFLAAAMVGLNWQLIVGTSLFILPNVLALFQHKLPNSRTLYHLMPQGLTNLAVSLWLGGASMALLVGVFGKTPDLALLGFALLPIPSVLLSVLKLFGRRGHDGEQRFYAHPKMIWFYRLGGAMVLYLVAVLTHTIPGPTFY